VQTSLSDNVHLNGGVTARVVHGTSVDLGDRHSDELMKRSVGWKSREKKGPQEVKEGWTADIERKSQLRCVGCVTSSGGLLFTDDPK
jgi:hypothetical protein